MSIEVPGIGHVPVIWRPSDLTGPDSDGHAGRLGYAIRALVHHRVVGSLESMVNSTFKPTSDDTLRAGERRVSSHFGIGFWALPDGSKQLRVYQFVALQDTAYCNGQTPSDKAACTWGLWKRLGRPPTNEITVSTEHEDNGKAGGYVVHDHIIRTSIALDRLLLSGNGPKIRAAGIRCSDGAAAQLGRIEPGPETIIDHHVIAPVSKPYCWRAIGDDAGFPRARFIRELTATDTEEDEVLYSVPGIVTAEAPAGTPHYPTATSTTPKGTTNATRRYLLVAQNQKDNPTRYLVDGAGENPSGVMSWVAASAFTGLRDELDYAFIRGRDLAAAAARSVTP